jgi:hypothetical protein
MRRANAIAYRSSEMDVRAPNQNEIKASLMTPERRAGLEALEREFSDLLIAQVSQAAQVPAG